MNKRTFIGSVVSISAGIVAGLRGFPAQYTGRGGVTWYRRRPNPNGPGYVYSTARDEADEKRFMGKMHEKQDEVNQITWRNFPEVKPGLCVAYVENPKHLISYAWFNKEKP